MNRAVCGLVLVLTTSTHGATVRGQNAGISHNPLESSTSDDMQLAVLAFQHLLEQLAKEQE